MSTKIEWTEKTWNPFVGCTKVSAGCKNCYAERHSYRLSTMPTTRELYGDVVSKKDGGDPRFTGVVKFAGEKTLLKPLSWRKPSMVFVNSMSDLFHESISFEEIDKVFAVMAACPQHTFQILTKRPERMKEYLSDIERAIFIEDTQIDMLGQDSVNKMTLKWPLPNVWLGVSAEDQETADERIPHLLETPAAVRFLSCEPLLGAINLTYMIAGESSVDVLNGCFFDERDRLYKEYQSWYGSAKIDWVIVGGESGKCSRPMHPDWARDLRDQCVNAGVAFFFKQWGDWLPRLQGWERKSEAEFQAELELYAQKKIPAPSHWKAKRPDLNSENKEWGCLTRSGEFYPETTAFNGNQENPEHDYETTVIRVGKSAAGRLLDGREWNELPNLNTKGDSND